MKKIILSLILLTGVSQAALVYQGVEPLMLSQHNIQNGPAPQISLVFKNTGAAVESLSASVSGTTQYKVAVNRCNNIPVGRSCQISISALKTIAVGNYSFSVAGVNIQQNIVKQNGLGQDIVSSNVEDISFESAPGTTQFVPGESSRMLYFSVKNIGNVNVSPTVEYTANPKLRVVINRCVSSSLQPARSCLFAARLQAPLPGESYSQSFSAKIGATVKDSASVPVAGVPFNVSGLSISPDKKVLTLTGSNFNQVNVVRLMSQDGSSLINEMQIKAGKTDTQMEVTPSSDIVLEQGTFTLRLLN